MISLYLEEHDCFIRYIVIPGDGPVHVYLPGLMSPSSATLLQVALDDSLRDRAAILVDYLGCGLSDRPSCFSHSIREHAATVAAILDNEGADQVTVIGHSMGGTVGLWLALDRPDLVGRLVMAESNLLPGGGDGTRRIAAFAEQEWTSSASAAEVEALRRDAVNGGAFAAAEMAIRGWGSDPRAVHAASVDLVGLDPAMQQRLFDLPIPRAFIYGELTLTDLAGRWTPDVPDPELLERHGITTFVVPDADHFMFIGNLDGYVAAVLAATT